MALPQIIIIIMLPFRHPFNLIVSGLMGNGLTEFIMRLVDNVDTMIEPTPCKMVYYFADYQPLFERYEGCVDFRHGMPKVDAIDRQTNAIVVFDDMMDKKHNISRCNHAVASESHTTANASHLLQPYVPILKKIARRRETRRRAYLRDCDCNIIDCFSECTKKS